MAEVPSLCKKNNWLITHYIALVCHSISDSVFVSADCKYGRLELVRWRTSYSWLAVFRLTRTRTQTHLNEIERGVHSAGFTDLHIKMTASSHTVITKHWILVVLAFASYNKSKDLLL